MMIDYKIIKNILYNTNSPNYYVSVNSLLEEMYGCKISNYLSKTIHINAVIENNKDLFVLKVNYYKCNLNMKI